MTAVLQIVDGLGGSLIVDLNGQTAGVGSYARTAPVLARGELVQDVGITRWSPSNGSAQAGRRNMEIAFLIVASSADDLAVRVAALNTATRKPWWLKVRRHSASADSWLQRYPCRPDIDTRITSSANPHMASGIIQCETEPYALGARVDASPVAVAQDPAVAGAFTLDVPNVAGDTETPLLVRINDGTAFGVPMTTFISVRRRGTPSNLTAAALTVQAEAGTLSSGTNVTLATLSDALLSGGSGVRATYASGYVTPASCQITFGAPSLSTDAAGVYRVFARVRRSAAVGTVTLKAFVTATGLTPDDINSAHPMAADTTQLIDLGLVQWPAGMPAGLESPLPSGALPTGIALQWWKATNGAGTVDVDYMVWIPADEDAGYIQTQAAIASAGSRWVVLDGPQMMAAIMDADPISGTARIVGQNSTAAGVRLSFVAGINVGPGSSRLFVVNGISTATSLAKGNTLNVGYSYWPRYTWLR